MPVRKPLVPLFLLSILSCDGSGPGNPPTDTVPGYPFAYAQADCAPWDGAAVAVTLTPVPVDSAGSTPAGSFLSVTLWKGRSDLKGQSFQWPAQPEPGQVARCDRAGTCESLTGGAVWIGAIGDTLRGALDVELAGGDRIRGTFAAQWIDRRVLCG